MSLHLIWLYISVSLQCIFYIQLWKLCADLFDRMFIVRPQTLWIKYLFKPNPTYSLCILKAYDLHVCVYKWYVSSLNYLLFKIFKVWFPAFSLLFLYFTFTWCSVCACAYWFTWGTMEVWPTIVKMPKSAITWRYI